MSSSDIHRISRFHFILAINVLMLMVVSCNRSTPNESEPVDPLKVILSQTPREDREAEFLAVHAANTLTAPEEVYQRIKTELASIREEYGDTVYQTEVHPIERIEPSFLIVVFLKKDWDDRNSVAYKSVDSMNQIYRAIPDAPIYYYYNGDSVAWVKLRFQGILNSCVLGRMYFGLGGLESVEFGWQLDGSDLFVKIVDSSYKYYFRYAYGDCPSGCIVSDLAYFNSNREAVITLVGRYRFGGNTQPRPPWADTALNIIWNRFCD